MRARTALIVGSRGQDGRLLSGLLARRGYDWLGVARVTTDGTLPWDGPVDITSAAAVRLLVGALRPDEIYHLAAHHQSAETVASAGSDLLERSFAVNVLSLGHVLEAVRHGSPASRVFYAASSHVFGEPEGEPQDESTPLAPLSVYGITKAAGLMLCRTYRRSHGVFASAGILYNHESEHRLPHFVSAKIVDGAVAIRDGRSTELVLGNLDAEADWGWAPEYVDAMTRILALDTPDEFVIASGRRRSVRDFVACTFDALSLDWRRHVRDDRTLGVRAHRGLVGNADKLRTKTGWRAEVELPELVALLLRSRGITAAEGRAAR